MRLQRSYFTKVLACVLGALFLVLSGCVPSRSPDLPAPTLTPAVVPPDPLPLPTATATALPPLPEFSVASPILFVCSPDGLVQQQFLCLLDAGSGLLEYRSTDPERVFRSLAWSRDGRRLAMVVSQGAEYSLQVLSSDGSSRTLLLTRHQLADIAWAPDGRLYFTYRRVEPRPGMAAVGPRQICYVAADAPQPLTEADINCLPVDGENAHPDISPDGRYVYFAHAAEERGSADIVRYSLGEGELENLPRTPDDDEIWPRVSPDGTRLAYVVRPNTTAQEWEGKMVLLDLATGAKTDLTPGEERGGQPAWSSDGAQVVFVSDRESDSQRWCEMGCVGYKNLFVMNVETREVKNLTANRAFSAERPTWVTRP